MMDYAIGSNLWPGLSKLVEECGEVLQVVGKIVATGGNTEHWDGNGSLRERLVEELADVLAAVHFVGDANQLSYDAIYARSTRKLALFHEWHKNAISGAVALVGGKQDPSSGR